MCVFAWRTVKELILEKCEVTGDPDDIKSASTLEDEIIDNEIEDIIGMLCDIIVITGIH